jgi:DNA polymerase III subunit epsilon
MKREYAIVDIETTGGNAQGSRITEIAIIIHDGSQVIERFETLVNPQKEIPLPIFALTGMTNEMVRHAPIFDDIAQEVFQLLNGRIFVAHNVNFDYSFVRHELEQAGFKFTARKLCTVRAARKVKPGVHSYSLENLCRSLQITNTQRHRAGSDADATAILFTKLLEWDVEGEIEKMLKIASQDQRLPPNVPPVDFEQLPEKPGVYYFYNRERKVVYVGKAINLKKRVASHFNGHKITAQRQNFLRDIYGISFEVCATELMALLLECTEIKKLWPVYNTALKRFDPKFGLYEYEARNGYKYLAITKLVKHQRGIEVFHSQYVGINLLRSLAERFTIDHRFCKYGTTAEGEGIVRQDTTNLPDVIHHNTQVANAIGFILQNKPSFVIIDKGRNADERSYILVEDGHFYGMGYVDPAVGFATFSEVKECLTPYKSNGYIMQLLYSFTQKYPGRVFFEKALAESA